LALAAVIIWKGVVARGECGSQSFLELGLEVSFSASAVAAAVMPAAVLQNIALAFATWPNNWATCARPWSPGICICLQAPARRLGDEALHNFVKTLHGRDGCVATSLSFTGAAGNISDRAQAAVRPANRRVNLMGTSRGNWSLLGRDFKLGCRSVRVPVFANDSDVAFQQPSIDLRLNEL
jgi:hypothetical protein